MVPSLLHEAIPIRSICSKITIALYRSLDPAWIEFVMSSERKH